MSDISYVEAATESIIPLLKKDDLILLSQLADWNYRKYDEPDLFEKPELKEIFIAYCPERVLPENAHELVHNDG